MDNKDQIVELVKRFIGVADELLKKGEIDSRTYEEITSNKINFLKQIVDKSV